MAIKLPKRHAPKTERAVIPRLLDSDPSIRWQVMRDLISSPAEEAAAERARVATEGAGEQGCLLSKRPTGGGAARHGSAGGTPPCTSSCCCGTYGSIERPNRHAAHRTLSATG
jgi:hypothetical protein